MRLTPRTLAVLWLAALASPALAADPFESLAVTFKKEVESGTPDSRLRMWARVSESKDPRAVDLAIEGTAKEVLRRDRIAKTQNDQGGALEKVLGDIEKENAKGPPQGPKEIEKYNKKMKGYDAKREAAYAALRDLAVDATQQRAVLAAAAAAVGRIVDSLPDADRPAAIEKVTLAWMGPKSPWDERVRWVEALSHVKGEEAGKALRAASLDEALDPRARGAAIDARFARADPMLLADSIGLLACTAPAVQMAAIEALRLMHRKESIDPLIEFLGREDIGEARGRAHTALRSLTAEKHGPYKAPWAEWWERSKATFVMPDKPLGEAELTAREAGLTFYGISTFSDKILFVLDVSGSMEELAHPGAAGARGTERKIDVLRKELSSTIDMLDDGKRFNLLLFNHRIIRYLAGALSGDKATRDAAKRFAVGVEPSSGTNIHDALETAFKMANSAADGVNYQAVFDTIFFLTDGTPTAGKLQKPADILASVAEWNKNAQVTVHCIGVGEASDKAFLQSLATAHHGQFVSR